MRLDTAPNSQSIKLLLLVDHVQVRLLPLPKSDKKCQKEDIEFFQFQKFQQWLFTLEEWSLCQSSTLKKKFTSNHCWWDFKCMPKIISPSLLKCQNHPPLFYAIEESLTLMPTSQRSNSKLSWTNKDGVGPLWEIEDTIV